MVNIHNVKDELITLFPDPKLDLVRVLKLYLSSVLNLRYILRIIIHFHSLRLDIYRGDVTTLI